MIFIDESTFNIYQKMLKPMCCDTVLVFIILEQHDVKVHF